MQKEELIQLLHDPDICHEIFLIVKNGGKPASASDLNKLAALKSQIQKTGTEKKAAASDTDKLAAIKAMLNKKTEEEPKVKIAEESKSSAVTPDAGGAFTDKLALLRNQVQKTNQERAAEQKAAAEKKASTSAAEKYTFVLERPCPVCGMNTHVVKCKSRLIAETTDLDLCIHYKDFNPYLYRVWACEHCGFAADEQKFTRRIPEKTRDKIMGFLQTANLAMPFVEERTSEQAIQYLEMAILFNELADPSPNRRGNLYLIMAWIYRYDGNKEKERAALDKAAELFDQSLETENYPVDKMSDTMATYLTGAIHVMRGDYDKATKHLSRIISNQALRTSSPKLFEMARDMWQDIKNAKEKG